jgi:hypothetical protein
LVLIHLVAIPIDDTSVKSCKKLGTSTLCSRNGVKSTLGVLGDSNNTGNFSCCCLENPKKTEQANQPFG